ncbi:MAG: group III truncated hemoglobin [Planctomycetes bacterium]|nr:group III truncated hemoglobin [Planctomycetota bacterium]
MTSAPVPAELTDADIAAQVDAFYDRVRSDQLLGPVFDARIAPDAWPAHLARMRDFWSTILLGRGRYRGNPLLVHRAIAAITREHHGRWLDLFEQVARELFAAPLAATWIDRAQRMSRTLQADLPADA